MTLSRFEKELKVCLLPSRRGKITQRADDLRFLLLSLFVDLTEVVVGIEVND